MFKLRTDLDDWDYHTIEELGIRLDDIESIDIACTVCEHKFEMGVNHNKSVQEHRRCPKCYTRHVRWFNNGEVIIDAVLEEIETEHTHETVWSTISQHISLVIW